MPRYEMVEGSSSKFWEITLDGASFTTTYGRIGTDGQSTTKEWKNEAEAKKQYDKLIAEKTKKGYELAEGDDDDEDGDDEGSEGASNPALEQAILADPDSPDGYLVYGDWLQSQGDALGELVAVQAALAADPSNTKLKVKSEELLSANEDEWLGEALSALKDDSELTCTWRYGFLHTVAMGNEEHSENAGVEAYEALAKCRVARFLRDLEINVFDTEDGNPEYDPMLDAMVEHGLPKTLRRLAFDVKSFQISWSHLGDLSKLYPQLKKLEELRIAMGDMTLGKIDLPSLKKLEIVTGGLDQPSLAAVSNAKWPKLESLVLYFGDENYGGNCSVADLQTLLSGKTVPGVKHLGLCNAGFQDDIAEAVAASKILPQLRSLDLSKGTMGDDGAQFILGNAKAFAHLERIDLSQNYITLSAADRLKAALGEKVIVTDQGDGEDEDDRYVQISE